jgi:hypothetical protein
VEFAMALRKDHPGSVAATILERLKIQLKRLGNHIDLCLDVMFTTTVILLGCLFAAEVALGRRVTQRDPEPRRRRDETGSRREQFLQSPASLNTPAGRGVEIFGRSAGKCPDNGGQTADGRTKRRSRGYFRCIHSPSCKNSRALSRFSSFSVQDWLKLNQPSHFPPPQRRPRNS